MSRNRKKPATIGDAFKLLDAMIPERDKEFFRSQSAEDFALGQHFGLGMWIRNAWIYGADEATYRALFGDDILHPDMASAEFLIKYHKHLIQAK